MVANISSKTNPQGFAARSSRFNPDPIESKSIIGRRFGQAMDGFIAIFAFWTIYCHILVMNGATFSILVKFSSIPLIFASIFIFFSSKRTGGESNNHISPIHIEPLGRIRWVLKLIIGAGIVGVYWWYDHYILFWISAVIYLVWASIDKTIPTSEASHFDIHEKPWIAFVLIILIFLAVGITLVAHRPDIDDAFYLNMSITSMDAPDNPLLTYDGMYGETDIPIFRTIYRLHTYELLIALTAYLSHISLYTVYYLFFPTILAAFIIIAHWVVIQRWIGKYAIFGLLVTFFVLLTWGDSHRSYGNFSFVRLFQGKSVLVSICIPSIIYYSLNYIRKPNVWTWAYLCFSQIAACGFTSSGIPVAPATAGTILIGSFLTNQKKVGTICIGLLASVYLIVIVFLNVTATETESSHTIAKAKQNISRLKKEQHTTLLSRTIKVTQNGLARVLGKSFRAYIALLALLFLSLYRPAGNKQVISGAAYTLIIFLTILNPFLLYFLSQLAANMSWRLFWSIPFPLIIGLCVAKMISVSSKNGRLYLGLIGMAVVLVVFGFSHDRLTLSKKNDTRIGYPRYKVSSSYYIAKKVVELSAPGGLVLAPWYISTWIPVFHHHPRTIGVRPSYLKMILKAKGREEYRKRKKMINFIRGSKKAERFLPEVLMEIAARPITTVVSSTQLHWPPEFGVRLKQLGFVHKTALGHHIWVLRNVNK